MSELRVGTPYLLAMEFLAVAKASLPSRVEERADPTTISVTVTPPTGAPTTYTYPTDITRAKLGVFWVEVPQTEAGSWVATVTSTGAAATVDTHRWRCFPV